MPPRVAAHIVAHVALLRQSQISSALPSNLQRRTPAPNRALLQPQECRPYAIASSHLMRNLPHLLCSFRLDQLQH